MDTVFTQCRASTLSWGTWAVYMIYLKTNWREKYEINNNFFVYIFFSSDDDHTFFLDKKSRQKNQKLIKTCRCFFAIPVIVQIVEWKAYAMSVNDLCQIDVGCCMDASNRLMSLLLSKKLLRYLCRRFEESKI